MYVWLHFKQIFQVTNTSKVWINKFSQPSPVPCCGFIAFALLFTRLCMLYCIMLIRKVKNKIIFVWIFEKVI